MTISPHILNDDRRNLVDDDGNMWYVIGWDKQPDRRDTVAGPFDEQSRAESVADNMQGSYGNTSVGYIDKYKYQQVGDDDAW